MSLFIDYIYSGKSPVPSEWKKMRQHVTLTFPIPLSGMKASPPWDDVEPIFLTRTLFNWYAITMGYGEPADYALSWLLKGFTIGPVEVADLRRLAQSRSIMLARAYEFHTEASGLLTLWRRGIYPLIEATEKVCISYYLGCVIAALCGPRAVEQRLGGIGNGIQYLFHRSLLATSAKMGKTVEVNSSSGNNVDFIGFDLKLGVHLFEAKGDGESLSYSALSHGLEQSLAVVSVTFPESMRIVTPTSINVCVAFPGRLEVNCGAATVKESIRCAVFALSGTQLPTEVEPDLMARHNELAQLVGTQLLGVYAFLQIAKREFDLEDWAVFSFSHEDLQLELPLVAVPSDLWKDINSMISDQMEMHNRVNLYENLERTLPSNVSNNTPQNIGDIRRNELKKRLQSLGERAIGLEERKGNKAWTRRNPPPGFNRIYGEPWIVFGNFQGNETA